MKWLIPLLFSLLAIPSQAQSNLGVFWKPEKDTVALGEPFMLRLILLNPVSAQDLVLPALTDSLGAFELLGFQWLDSANGRHGFQAQLVAYDSGSVHVPILSLGFLNKTDTIFVLSPECYIEVLAPAVDIDADFQNILDNPNPGFHWHEILLWIGLFVLLLLVAGGIYLALRKRNRQAATPVWVKPDPFVVAFDALRILKENQDALTEPEIKEYYTKTVDVLRTLVQAVYALDVTEMTSSEWLHLWKRRPEHQFTGKELMYVLHIADLVKFAKQHPGPVERRQLIEAAEAFVTACKNHSQSFQSNSNE
jgi:hypothetical protein